MPLVAVFILGVANFYLHRAVMDGREPVFAEIATAIRKIGGRWGSYGLEFAILVGAMWFAARGEARAPIFYGGYTLINWFGYHLLKTIDRP